MKTNAYSNSKNGGDFNIGMSHNPAKQWEAVRELRADDLLTRDEVLA